MSEKCGGHVCATSVTKTNDAREDPTCWCVTCYSEKGCTLTPVVGIGNLPPIIDLVVVPWVAETGVDSSSKVIKADGAHIVDLKKAKSVICPEYSLHDDATVCKSNATDMVVTVSRCDYGTLTWTHDTNWFGNSSWTACGEVAGISADCGVRSEAVVLWGGVVVRDVVLCCHILWFPGVKWNFVLRLLLLILRRMLRCGRVSVLRFRSMNRSVLVLVV